MTHPYRDVAIVGVHNTPQARRLAGHDSHSIGMDGVLGALADAGLTPARRRRRGRRVRPRWVLELRPRPVPRGAPAASASRSLLDAAAMIASRASATSSLVGAGGAGIVHRPGGDRAVDAPGQRARRRVRAVHRRRVRAHGPPAHDHLRHDARAAGHRGGDDPQQRPRQPRRRVLRQGPVHARRRARVADGRRPVPPPRLRDDLPRAAAGSCSTTAERAADLAQRHRCGSSARPATRTGRRTRCRRCGISAGAAATTYRPATSAGGRRGSRSRWPGLGHDDVDVAELYDPFSFEIIRQLEAFGFCGDGEGGAFVEDGHIAPGGRLPVTTDGGTMSFSHAGINAQLLQRVIRGVQQVRGTCPTQPGRRRRGGAVHQRRLGCAVHRCRSCSGASGRERCADAEAVLLPQPVGVPTGIRRRRRDRTGTAAASASCATSGAATCGGANLRPAPTCMACGGADHVVVPQRGPGRAVQLDRRVAAAAPVVPGSLRAGDRAARRGLLPALGGRRVHAR